MFDITVIVVTYDRPALLVRALDSLVRQTLPADRFDVVVVNDAGADPSASIENFTDKLSITLIQHDANRGISAALNTGLGGATGRYICFLADDDLYYPRHLEGLLERCEELGGRTIVYGDTVMTHEDDHGMAITRQMHPVPAAFNHDALLVANYIPGNCILFPRAVFDEIGSFDESFEALEDWDMLIRAAGAFPFERLLEPVAEVRWRQTSRDNNTTRDRPKHYTFLERLYAKHPAPPGLQPARARHLAGSRQHLADDFAYDLSVLLVSQGDLEKLGRSLVSIVEQLGESGDFEVVIAAERTTEMEEFATALEGDVLFVFGAVTDTDAAFEVLERKAAGRRRARLLEGELLNVSV